MRILIVSNGHGEDAIGAHLAGALLARRPDLSMEAFTLVGPGAAYDRAGIPVLFRSQSMPSGGFGWQHPALFARDLASGFFRLTAAQMDALRRARRSVDGLLLVGDIYPVLMTMPYRVPKVLVATARSDYIAGHLAIEAAVMARSLDLVLPRDEITTRSLRRRGVRAVSAGNVMMDLIRPTGVSLGLDPDRPVVALLPGSRQDAPDNLAALAGVTRRVMQRLPAVQAAAALASPVPPGPLPPGEWRVEAATQDDRAQGVSAWLVAESGRSCRIALTYDGFGDLLHRSDVVVGLSGTANEQAAGLGRPVVAFSCRGVQYTRRFAERQKRLLGDALVLVPGPEQAAERVVALLEDPAERRRRGSAGQARMGPPGAVERMLPFVERCFGLCPSCPSP